MEEPRGMGHRYMYHVICYDCRGRRVFSDWMNWPPYELPNYFKWAKEAKPNMCSCVVLKIVARITVREGEQPRIRLVGEN